MRCPVCHSDVSTFTPVDEVHPDLHAHLTISCPLWQSAEGICHTCTDHIELVCDQTLQSILNGTPLASISDQSFIYRLTEREEPYWSHPDPKIQQWFRSELRRRVEQLAQGEERHTWKIISDDQQALDEGIL